MPGIERYLNRYLRQIMLYWKLDSNDQYGTATYVDPQNPIAIKCRWEDREKEILTKDNRKVLTKAVIMHTYGPLKVGSLVFLGTLEDWKLVPNYPNPPTVNNGGHEVMHIADTADLKQLGTVRVIYV